MRATTFPWTAASACSTMNLAVLAFLSGGLLFLTSTAVVALQLNGITSKLWWIALAAVALCHAGMGFLAMRGDEAFARGQRGTGAFCLAASLAITAAASVAAALAAIWFPIALSPGVAFVLIAASISVGGVVLAAALGDPRRGFVRGPNSHGRQ